MQEDKIRTESTFFGFAAALVCLIPLFWESSFVIHVLAGTVCIIASVNYGLDALKGSWVAFFAAGTWLFCATIQLFMASILS